MKVAVWDTFVVRKDRKGIMHFDIIVPDILEDRNQIKSFGLKYLNSKGFETEGITMDKCNFCHIDKVSENTTQEINQTQICNY